MSRRPIGHHPLVPAVVTTLLPGLRVTRRADRHLQVGLDASLAVAFPDTPEVRLALGAVERGEPPPSGPAAARVYRRLAEEGLLVDVSDLQAALVESVDGPATAAVFAHADLGAADLLARRRRARIRVVGPDRETGLVLDVLTRAGVGLHRGVGDPTAVLILGSPEFDRQAVDRWVQRGIAHLLVQCVDAAWWIGPFVLPGENACLRCVDAHRRDLEPGRALVAAQYADRRTSRPGVPEPIDPALATVAMGWAARDLMSFVDAERPSTWSASVRIGPALWIEQHPWSRHPECGCAWDLVTA